MVLSQKLGILLASTFASIAVAMPDPSENSRGAHPAGKGKETAGSSTPGEPARIEKAKGPSQSIDSLGRKAAQAQTNVAQNSQEVIRLIGEIQKLAQQIEPGDYKTESELFTRYGELIPRLEQIGRGLIDREGEIDGRMNVYRVSLDEAVKRYEELARAYDEKAGRHADPEFREKYLSLARTSRLWAQSMATRAQAINQDDLGVRDSIAYVQSALEFLKDLRPVIEIGSKLAEQGGDVSSYAADLKDFIQQFRKAVAELEKVAEKVRDTSAGGGEPPIKPASGGSST